MLVLFPSLSSQRPPCHPFILLIASLSSWRPGWPFCPEGFWARVFVLITCIGHTRVSEGRDQIFCPFPSSLGPRPVPGIVLWRYWFLLYSRPSRQMGGFAREGGKVALSLSEFGSLLIPVGPLPIKPFVFQKKKKKNFQGPIYALGCSRLEEKESRALGKVK